MCIYEFEEEILKTDETSQNCLNLTKRNKKHCKTLCMAKILLLNQQIRELLL